MKQLWVLPLLMVSACAEGGEESKPQSEVTINASHHMFALRSEVSLGSLPIQEETVVTQHGLINLFDDSTYSCGG